MKWLKESNRLKHLGFGFMIFFVITFIQLVLTALLQINIEVPLEFILRLSIGECFTSLLAVASSMASVEYILWLQGGKFDWLDILAGCLVPLIIVILAVVLIIIL